jgi:hypothetical protein
MLLRRFGARIRGYRRRPVVDAAAMCGGSEQRTRSSVVGAAATADPTALALRPRILSQAALARAARSGATVIELAIRALASGGRRAFGERQ